MGEAQPIRRHIATVLLQDYFHRGLFQGVLGEKQWARLETRLEAQVGQVCKLLRRFDAKATFFTLGWIADKQPHVIRMIVQEGHEIASAGYYVRRISEMSSDEFAADLHRAREALEKAGANRIVGYRCPQGWINGSTGWALEVLVGEGYLYDASVRPGFWRMRQDGSRFLHKKTISKGTIWEVPVATDRTLGFQLLIAGGNYWRQFPHWLMLSRFEKWCRKSQAPFVLYFHPWELDLELPRVSAIDALSRIRQYRNLGKLEWVLPDYLSKGQFESVGGYLGLQQMLPQDHPSPSEEESNQNALARPKAGHPSLAPLPVSLIVPCYNEASSLIYLSRSLEELFREADGKYVFELIFVDDGSTDGTLDKLSQLFGSKAKCRILHHRENQGLTTALRTGLQAAENEVVCSIDADCSYDPLELMKMIPLLADGVDLVTASPYHERGSVQNVPAWRLFLSRRLSGLYRKVLNTQLATYTACFRVYRKSSVADLQTQQSGFLGVVELLARLDAEHGIIKEYPTTLHCRILGHSKLKVMRTVLQHLILLLQIYWSRIGVGRTENGNRKADLRKGPPPGPPRWSP